MKNITNLEAVKRLDNTESTELITTNIDYVEIKDLISCQIMLDLILKTKTKSSVSDNYYYNDSIIRAVENLRFGKDAQDTEYCPAPETDTKGGESE